MEKIPDSYQQLHKCLSDSENIDWTRVLNLTTQILAAGECGADLLFAHAYAFFNLGRLEEASSAAHELLQHFPQHEDGRALLLVIQNQLISGRVVSIDEYKQRSPTRFNFIRMPGFEGIKVPFHDTPQPFGLITCSDCVLIGWHAVFATLEGDIFKEQNYGTQIPDDLQALPQDSPETPEFDEILSLCNRWANGFYHWMLDYLPKVVMAEACGYRGHYLVPHNSPFADETLEMLGIAPARVIAMRYPAIRTKRLVIPTHLGGPLFSANPKFARLFRDRMRSLVQEVSVPKRERVFLARKDPNRPRRVLNEADVFTVLKKYGFQQLYMEDYSIREQIAFASHIQSLAGPHGAGMIHSFFMPLRSLVIEFFSPMNVNYATVSTAEVMEHHYCPLVSPTADINTYPHGEEILVSLPLLEITLKKTLQASRP